MYTLFPPIRPSEWISSIFLDKDDGKSNHVNLKKGQLVIYEQKNGKFKKFKLSAILVAEMKNMKSIWHEIWPDEKTEYVCPSNENGYKRLSVPTLSVCIKDLFGYTINDLRKIYEGSVYKYGDDDTYLYVCRILGHLPETSKKDYIKDLSRSKIWGNETSKSNNLDIYMHNIQKVIINVCQGTTKTGRPCSIKIKDGSYCRHHRKT